MSGPPTWQLATAVYIPLLTGNLSVVGSGLIIYSMLVHGRRTKLRKPHHRILLAMSIYDLFYSLVKAFTFLLTPAEGQPGSMGVPGAMGNLATCRLQGFFIETAHATGAYNSLLSIYFWLSICRGVKNDTFTKYEPIAHILIFVVFVGFAIAGVVIELFNPAFGFCFIASYPPGCESGPGAPVCERWPPRTMGLMYEIFAQMWVQAYIVIVVVTNAAIWYKVHTQEKVIRSINQRVLSNTMEAGLAQKKKEASRERMVAVQSTLYVTAFIACWSGPTAFHLADWIAGFKSFWAVLVIVIFTPLQGFFNAFVFARPTYIRLRRAKPELGRLQTVKMIFFTPDPMTAVKSSAVSSRSPFSFADMPSIRPTNRLVDDDSFVEDGDAANGDLSAPDYIAVEEKNDEYANEDTTLGTTAKKVIFKECQSSSDE
uniref:G-protein coupled receptors family 1 profile domain-containing protein n=1 Tax=Skeletonema marinoi TaxID=267567 RepID=A0A7S2Q273_9STRA